MSCVVPSSSSLPPQPLPENNHAVEKNNHSAELKEQHAAFEIEPGIKIAAWVVKYLNSFTYDSEERNQQHVEIESKKQHVEKSKERPYSFKSFKRGKASALESIDFPLKSRDKNIQIPQDVGPEMIQYFSLLEIHFVLKRINKAFREGVSSFIHCAFRETSLDISRISDAQLLSYSFQYTQINPLILKAFGRSLVEAPFLGYFKDTSSIPSHEGHAIVRGVVNRDHPFISFYIAHKNKQPFVHYDYALNTKEKESCLSVVQSSIPAIRFTYECWVGGLDSTHQNKELLEKYMHSDHELRFHLDSRLSVGERNDEDDPLDRSPELALVSEICEGEDDRFCLYNGPIEEIISKKGEIPFAAVLPTTTSEVEKKQRAEVVSAEAPRKTSLDVSRISDAQLATYFLQYNKIDTLILKAFGRPLVEAPFLDRFKDISSIPSHEGHAIARGTVGTVDDVSAFISLYIARKNKQPFVYSQDGGQSSIPAIRLIFLGSDRDLLYCSSNNHDQIIKCQEEHPEDPVIQDIGRLYYHGFRMMGEERGHDQSYDLALISQICEGEHEHLTLYAPKEV